MDYTYQAQDGQARIEITGRIDQQDINKLKEPFLRLEVDAVERVELDFKNVSYIGSTGIATLLQLHKRLASRGGGLNLVNLSPDMANLFEALKLDRIFGIGVRP